MSLFAHDAPRRAQGAGPQQAADRADHARHDHRRLRRHHHGRARTRRPGGDRDADPVGAGTNHDQGAGRATSAAAGSAWACRPGAPTAEAWRMSEAIRETGPRMRNISRPASARGTRSSPPNRNWNTHHRGHRCRIAAQIRVWNIELGTRSSTRRMSRSAAKVAVLGSVVRDNLFGEGTDPVGAAHPDPEPVVPGNRGDGRQGRRRQFGQDQDDTPSSSPYTTVQKKLRGRDGTNISENNHLGGLPRQHRPRSPTKSRRSSGKQHRPAPGRGQR